MENASKALLIASGVFIALIVISLFISMFAQIASVKKANEEKVQNEQLREFNASFEAYNKGVMYVTDLITLINKVSENNKKNENQITIYVNGVAKNSSTEYINKVIEKDVFKCSSIKYNSLGRVSEIYIDKY